MKNKANAMILGSFAADSLALGAHWIYDTALIDQKFGRVDHLLKPLENSYHVGKELGEFTHYGDQTLCLLESLTISNGFDIDHFAGSWREMFRAYAGYFDQATKATLKNLEAGKDPSNSGSDSSELGGAARIGPLVYFYREDELHLILHTRAQTQMTHNNANVIRSAEFFAYLALRVLRGDNPTAAIRNLSEDRFNEDPFSKWISEGMESVKMDTRQAILNFGQMCGTPAAFPSVIHLIAKYEDDLKEALVENVMAGGDSAARGLLVGLILGAHLGPEAIPKNWLSNLKQYQKIVDLLQPIGRR